MVVKNNKIIITDCDGVLLDWEEGFSVWMEHHGHEKVDGYQYMYNIGDRYGITKEQGKKSIKTFNESAAIGFLPPLRDAQYYVKLLAEKHQYRFVVLTSLSLDPYAKELRIRNLNKIFGDIFLDVICLDTGADKDEALDQLALKYQGNYWVEDKPENVMAGVDRGFTGILIEHGHNMGWEDTFVAKKWEDIYNLVTRNEKQEDYTR
jgi:FMN phosphatase YigB (HAD superfamily)